MGVAQLIKIFPAFYRTQWFITVLIRAHHGIIIWIKWIKSTCLHCISLKTLLKLPFICAQVFQVDCSPPVFWFKFCTNFLPPPCRGITLNEIYSPVSYQYYNGTAKQKIMCNRMAVQIHVRKQFPCMSPFSSSMLSLPALLHLAYSQSIFCSMIAVCSMSW
jgi:hypothetical protein